MAKKFVLRILLVTLIYLLLAGVITAADNSSHSLTGSQSDKIYLDEIKNFTSQKF